MSKRCMSFFLESNDLDAVIAGDAKHAEDILRWAKEIEAASRPDAETAIETAKWKVKFRTHPRSCDNCGFSGTMDCPKSRVSQDLGELFTCCFKHDLSMPIHPLGKLTDEEKEALDLICENCPNKYCPEKS